MSFGGSVSAMISSIKNNARSKRKTYFDRNNSASKNKDGKRNALLDKKATSEQLEEIKRKMSIENKQIRNKNILIYSCAIILILLGIVYLDM